MHAPLISPTKILTSLLALRKSTNKKVGYLQITGQKIGTFVCQSDVEKPDRYGGKSRALLTVNGGEAVANFIGSEFTNESLVTNVMDLKIIERIEALEDEIEDLKKMLILPQ